MINKTKFYGEFYKKLAIKRRRETQFYSKNRIFASCVSKLCELQVRYDFEGHEKKPSFIWHGCEKDTGDAIHKSIQLDVTHAFGDNVSVEKYYRLLIDEIKINPKLDMEFSGVVFELKTVDETPAMPRQKDVKQANFYMGASNQKKAVISYFNRKGLHLASFEINFNQDMHDKSLAMIARIIRNENLKHDTRDCSFCPYGYMCKYYDPR
jgi:hypothetical protein